MGTWQQECEVVGGLAVALFPCAGQELGAEARARFAAVFPTVYKKRFLRLRT